MKLSQKLTLGLALCLLSACSNPEKAIMKHWDLNEASSQYALKNYPSSMDFKSDLTVDLYHDGIIQTKAIFHLAGDGKSLAIAPASNDEGRRSSFSIVKLSSNELILATTGEYAREDTLYYSKK